MHHIGDEGRRHCRIAGLQLTSLGLRNLVYDLIVALHGLAATRLLPSISGKEHLYGDLKALHFAAHSNHFDIERIIERIKPLLKAVLDNDPDEYIWDEVYNAVNAINVVTVVPKPIPQPRTPPESVPSTYDSTPISFCSKSQQGNELTRMLLQKIFEEIKNCTYRDVEGFFEKYLEGKDWTRRALDFYKAMKDQHADGVWTGLPNPLGQDKALE